jgi:hypothetical protein
VRITQPLPKVKSSTALVSRVVNLTSDFPQRVAPFQNDWQFYNASMISERESTQSEQMIDMVPQNASRPGAYEEPTLLALFRLIIKDPAVDHDFRTCATCKRYGITEI